MASVRILSPAFLVVRRISHRQRFFIPEVDFSTPSPSKEWFARVCYGTGNTLRRHCLSIGLDFTRQAFSSESSDKCWSCGSSSPFLCCHFCGSAQPVDPSVNYFQIFGVEKHFDMEGENLQTKYKEWQKKLHPDLFHTKSEKERMYAAAQSSHIIEAYRTLTKPLSRALYLLQLQGVHVDQEKTISDPELLMEAMEVRESVEEAADVESLNQIRSQIQAKLEHWCKLFANAFKNGELEDAVKSVQRITYYERAIAEIVKKLLLAALCRWDMLLTAELSEYRFSYPTPVSWGWHRIKMDGSWR